MGSTSLHPFRGDQEAVSIRVLKKLGGGKSDAVHVYVRDGALDLCNSLATLGLAADVPTEEKAATALKSKEDSVRRNGFRNPGTQPGRAPFLQIYV